MNRIFLIRLSIVLIFIYTNCEAQMHYEFPASKSVSVGSYGRVGVDWSFENNGSIGRRLNLNNMGSIGGRLEEQDYLELAGAFGFKPFRDGDSTKIYVQTRFSFFSRSLSLFGNTSTSDLGGLNIALPELFLAAENINNRGVNVWVGARLYRGPDIHIADHRYFNDHSGQGFGVEFKNTRFAAIFISSTDTSSTLPPYFYLNIATGTPSYALQQRSVWTLQHDLQVSENNLITFLAEYHRLGNKDQEYENDTSSFEIRNFSDYGLVGGIRMETNIPAFNSSYNRVSIRYGSRIANGGDGGLSRTWLTFGAPDTSSINFEGAYSISFTDEIFLNLTQRTTLNAYVIYTQSKGGAEENGLSKTFYGKEVFNRKEDMTIGLRSIYRITDKFHLMGEIHFSQRRDGEQDWYRMTKLSFAPLLVPAGDPDFWARPQIRFISSVAFYNNLAKENMYSPYLQFVGPKSWGYFFGLKAEWWIWN